MTKILIDEATVKLAIKAFKECHYYMLDAGLPNQSLLNQAFTAHESLAEALAELPAQQEPVAWISEIRCIGPEYGKKRYSDLPIQSLQPGYYAHTPLYTTPQAQPAPEIAIADAYRAGVDSGIAAEREACAEMCSDIDGGENMFSRAIRARGST